MATFKVRVACDLFGSKHNAMFLFKPPPTMLFEIVAEATRFYQDEAESRKPQGHVGPAFSISSLQIYDQVSTQWKDVEDVTQLTDGCQLYAIQGVVAQDVQEQQTPQLAAVQPKQTPQQLDAQSNEDLAFATLDTKQDGVITLDEMVSVFKLLPLRFTPGQVQDLFLVADADQDGVVTRAEFERFAMRFPSVIDSIFQKKSDEEVLARESAVLRGAEAALAAEQEVEKKLLEEAANASQRVRNLMGQIADHKLSHEVQLQKKPVVDAQQQQLIEQELALAAQKERLRQAHQDIRQDIEDQLNAVSASIGIASPQQQQQQQRAHHHQEHHDDFHDHHTAQQDDTNAFLGAAAPAGNDVDELGSISENTSSFFLPSDSPRHPGKMPSDWNESLPPTPSVRPRIEIGAEVEACNFGTNPEFNGLRGRVTSLKDDGKICVEFLLRGGLTLDMMNANVKAVSPATNPALGEAVEATGTANGTASNSQVDLRGKRGKVVGFRNGVVLCEFAPRPGIFEVSPTQLISVTPFAQQTNSQQQQSQLQALQQVLREELPSQGNSMMNTAMNGTGGAPPPGNASFASMQDVLAQHVQSQMQGAPEKTNMADQHKGMAAELEDARREAELLKRELAAERSRKGAVVANPGATTSPHAAAALERLGQLGGSPRHGSPVVAGTLPTSPLGVLPPVLLKTVDEPRAVWGGVTTSRTVSPARRAVSEFRGLGTLLPSTQEILKKVNALGAVPAASATVSPSPTQSPALQSTNSVGGTYKLGPIDPSTL